jgi:hypothetical protein
MPVQPNQFFQQKIFHLRAWTLYVWCPGWDLIIRYTKIKIVLAVRDDMVCVSEIFLLEASGRVTRLGDFSPIGSLFSFERFLKMRKEGQSFGELFSSVKVMHYFWQKGFFISSKAVRHRNDFLQLFRLPKMGWATLWVIFFTDSSGRPGHWRKMGYLFCHGLPT